MRLALAITLCNLWCLIGIDVLQFFLEFLLSNATKDQYLGLSKWRSLVQIQIGAYQMATYFFSNILARSILSKVECLECILSSTLARSCRSTFFVSFLGATLLVPLYDQYERGVWCRQTKERYFFPSPILKNLIWSLHEEQWREGEWEISRKHLQLLSAYLPHSLFPLLISTITYGP